MVAMETVSKVIKSWLVEYKSVVSLQDGEYVSKLHNNKELTAALYKVLHQESELLNEVCPQLFDYFRSGHKGLYQFTLQFTPALIGHYLLSMANKERTMSGRVEALLLGMYNLEAVDSGGQPTSKVFTVPTMAKPSLYHEPVNLASMALTETALSRHEQQEVHATLSAPHPYLEAVTAHNRLSMLTYVLSRYNADIVNMPSDSKLSLCQVASRLCTNNLRGSHSSSSEDGPEPRVPLSSAFLVEILAGLYQTLYTGHSEAARQAVEDVSQRARYELFPEATMMSNAIMASMKRETPCPDTPLVTTIYSPPSSPQLPRTSSPARVTSGNLRKYSIRRKPIEDVLDDKLQTNVAVDGHVSSNTASPGKKGKTSGTDKGLERKGSDKTSEKKSDDSAKGSKKDKDGKDSESSSQRVVFKDILKRAESKVQAMTSSKEEKKVEEVKGEAEGTESDGGNDKVGEETGAMEMEIMSSASVQGQDATSVSAEQQKANQGKPAIKPASHSRQLVSSPSKGPPLSPHLFSQINEYIDSEDVSN
ncbi:PREDICTED: hyccin-like [Branchiostoma belcheri]|uniref:Hyccin-like n=1 Tax=Branchiostoma belcheri TaxID=7741 RepID=A0A6P4ZBS6_BRABE|nr:PREDICTED: hyccin-like [Branchiostoma belcheri]